MTWGWDDEVYYLGGAVIIHLIGIYIPVIITQG